jgi:hypothetical protein
MLVKKSSAMMNEKDLGIISRPTWPVTFDDAIPSVHPLMKLVNLYVRYAGKMLADSR